MYMKTLFKRISRPGLQPSFNLQRRSLVFKVERCEPELVSPAKPTPYEFKNLSNLDNSARLQVPLIQFYRNNVEMEGKDPAKIIKEAISKALVFYYPFAGRLREGLNGKLMVECTGEGAMFIEANADVRLEQFGDLRNLPFTGIQNLLYDGPGLGVIIHSPMLLIQVTRFLCGGFVFSLHLNHTISDGAGVVQFMTAVGELARGAQYPSVQPIWRRELLNARDPLQISCVHSFYQELNEPGALPLDDAPQTHRSFFFGSNEIAALRNHLPVHLRNSTKFEILAACLWRSRTVAVSPISDDKIAFVFPVNARSKFNPPLPVGYYGNALGMPVALSTARKLCNNPLAYAVEFIKKAQEDVTDEFMRSSVDLLEKKFTRQPITMNWWHALSDLTQMGYNDVDFGWGKPTYGGPSRSFRLWSFLLPTKNSKGEEGVSLAITLPGPLMERFSMEIDKLISEPHT